MVLRIRASRVTPTRVFTVAALVAFALVLAPPAGPSVAAGTCPTVDAVTGKVDPAPAADVDWRGCDLRGADLTEADLREANLKGAQLVRANLNGAEMGDATLDRVTSGGIGGTPGHLPTGWSLTNGYLVGPHADLTGADLHGASLYLRDLTYIDFTDASLAGADLSQSKLGNAVLTGADLSATDLGGVQSGGIEGDPAHLPSHFLVKAGYLIGPGVDLSFAQLPGLDLSGVDLTGTNLTAARLSGSNLSGANLHQAVMSNGDQSGANFTGANIDETIIGPNDGIALTGVVSSGMTGTPTSLPTGWVVTSGKFVSDTGLLRAVTSPAVASQILVDGRITDSWGLQWLPLPTGSHQVCFTAVPGFTTPPCQTVNLTRGVTSVVTGTFTQRGYLHVATSPPVASRISIDGIPRDNWGVYTDVPTGSHQVCFGAVVGFTPPACQTVSVTAGATASVAGTFISAPGSASGLTGVGFLRVTTSPALPSQITVDGNIADTWGLNWLELAPGNHTVCFGHLQGWTEPSCQTATVTAGATTTVQGTFSQRIFLKVTTSPSLPATIYTNGLPADVWGVYTDLPMPPDPYFLVGGVAGHIRPNYASIHPGPPGSTQTITFVYP